MANGAKERQARRRNEQIEASATIRCRIEQVIDDKTRDHLHSLYSVFVNRLNTALADGERTPGVGTD